MPEVLAQLRPRMNAAAAVFVTFALALGFLVMGSNTARAATVNLDQGQLSWGLKESFRNYIVNPVAHGGWELSDGATEDPTPFQFPNGTGTYDTDTDVTQMAFDGAVRFTGHDGILDITLAEIRISTNADGTGALVADMASREFVSTTEIGQMVTYDDVVLATLDGATITTDAAGLSTVSVPTVLLTEEGAQAFGGFYEPGTSLDPLSFTVAAVVPEPTTPAPTTAAPTTAAPTTAEPTTSEPTTAAPTTAAPTTGAPTTSAPTTAPTAPATTTAPNAQNVADASGDDDPQAAVCIAHDVTTGNISWGLKSSFRNYITGAIAHGQWTLDGLAYSGDAFVWSTVDGSFNGAAKAGSISGTGMIRFTGHDGVLNLTIANPRLVVNGNTGTLYVDVTSTDMEGNPSINSTQVAFATVNTSSLTVSGTTVALAGGAATLTATGATAFAGFYEAGTELDPLSFTANLGGETACTDSDGTAVSVSGVSTDAAGGGSLADTGFDAAVPAALAAAALIGGAALVRIGRRVQ